MNNNGQEPGLSQGNRPYAAPMLGGDRAVMVPCETCGAPTIRDFFGNWVCISCMALRAHINDVISSGRCQVCGKTNQLIWANQEEVVNHYERKWHYTPDMSHNCVGAVYCKYCETHHLAYWDGIDFSIDWVD